MADDDEDDDDYDIAELEDDEEDFEVEPDNGCFARLKAFLGKHKEKRAERQRVKALPTEEELAIEAEYQSRNTGRRDQKAEAVPLPLSLVLARRSTT